MCIGEQAPDNGKIILKKSIEQIPIHLEQRGFGYLPQQEVYLICLFTTILWDTQISIKVLKTKAITEKLMNLICRI